MDGYVEGAVLNTRFGSFPHSTLIGVPWGAQVRASDVDTGSRGWARLREKSEAGGGEAERKSGRKRKRDDSEGKQDDWEGEAVTEGGDESELEGDGDEAERSEMADAATPTSSRVVPPAARSGYVHILPPTPELWTISLPHRTQVVYTPDYSFILQRIRARPGTRLIEAGAGSGSFTHAAARAVYNGSYGDGAEESSQGTEGCRQRHGRVFSFECDETRYHKMRQDIEDHGLRGLVELTHRDVYNNGFLLDDGTSPCADAVFLDLPAPWQALPHLSRRKPQSGVATKKCTPGGVASGVSTSSTSHPVSEAVQNGEPSEDTSTPWVSPLDPARSVHICTFSPCIEQVQRTVSAMRTLGWVDIEMIEIANRRLVTMPETAGPWHGGGPRTVNEAIERLVEIEKKNAEYQAANPPPGKAGGTRAAKPAATEAAGEEAVQSEGGAPSKPPADAIERSGAAEKATSSQKGQRAPARLVHRTETDVHNHTSYLVFAVLPREWSESDEAAALARWPVPTAKAAAAAAAAAQAKGADVAAAGSEEKVIIGGLLAREERKRLKREAMEEAQRRNRARKGAR